MSVEVSPAYLLPPPTRAEPFELKRRQGVSLPTPTTSRLDAVLNRIASSRSLWLTPILVLQAVLCFRLSNGLAEDEALAINSGHQMIAHLLHGSATPSFGHYFAGVPSVYAIPAAMLDQLGGPSLVRAANTVLVLIATVIVYAATRRMFGQGAGLLAGAAFALNPATIFAARFASADAPCLLALAAAFYFALKASQRTMYPLLAGALMATAVAEKYVAVLFIPGIIAVALVVARQRSQPRRAAASTGLLAAATLGSLAIVAALARHDWQGFTNTVLGGHTSTDATAVALVHDGGNYLALLALAGLGAAVALRGRRLQAGLLCAGALVPVGVQILWHSSASLERNVAFSLVLLAPVVGAAGAWLVRQGKHLGVRAPLALAAAIVLLGSGMATSAQLIHSWPASTSIDSALRYYAHRGSDRYLVDGSDLPAYYLSHVTNYDQWVSTLDPRYTTAGGTSRLHADLENANYTLVLYRGNGATPALDRSMVATLRTRYTLVARVPVSPQNPTTYWSLWLAELPT